VKENGDYPPTNFGLKVALLKWSTGTKSVVYCTFLMLRAKNYQNRPMFHGVIQKMKTALIFETRCIRVAALRIQVSEQCKVLLDQLGVYEFDDRGQVEVKVGHHYQHINRRFYVFSIFWPRLFTLLTFKKSSTFLFIY